MWSMFIFRMYMYSTYDTTTMIYVDDGIAYVASVVSYNWKKKEKKKKKKEHKLHPIYVVLSDLL